MEVYDIATDTWSELPFLPVPRVHCGAVMLDATIYAIGGLTSKTSRGGGEGQERRFSRQLRRAQAESNVVPVGSHRLGPGAEEWEDWTHVMGKHGAVLTFAS